MPALLVLLLSAFLLPSSAAADEREEAARQSMEALYDLDYEDAMAHIRGHIDAAPADPFGYLFEAGLLFWRETTEPGVLKSSAPMEARFLEDIDLAQALSHDWLASDSAAKRADAEFITGLTLGIRAQWELTYGRWLKAYLDSRRGKRLQERCLKNDPGYYDAHIGIGLYLYLTDRLPGILGIGARWLIRGDAAKGKESLRIAMEKGRWPFAASQAASNLLTIYGAYEGDLPHALGVARHLLTRFPNSPYFRFAEILILARSGDWTSSHERALSLYDRAAQDPAILGGKRKSMLCGLAGADCLKPETLGPVVDWLTRALTARGPEPAGWRTLIHLYRGVALDIMGKRPEALTDYRAVLELPDHADFRATARKCILDACTRDSVLRELQK